MSIPGVPDFRDLIAQYDRLADEWGAQAEQLQEAIAQAATQITRPEFTLTVSGVRITELTFGTAAASTSPVQLRESLLTAYAEALAKANNAQANAVATIVGDDALGEAVRATVPGDVRDRTASVELEHEHAEPGHDRTESTPRESILDWLSDPSLDDAVVSLDINETMSDVEGWDPLRPRTDPEMLQYELEKQVQAISARAGDLAQTMETVTAEQDSKYLTVTVNAAGRLLDLRLHQAFTSADPTTVNTDFATLYNTATAEASHQALATLSESEHSEDDPTLGFFAETAAGAERALAGDEGRDSDPDDR